MAAVLFAWESSCEEHADESQDQTDNREGRSHVSEASAEEESEVKKTVDQADEADVRSFLVDILQRDEKLFTRFKTSLSPEISQADMERYKRQVDASIRKYLGRDHFISYYEAYDFIREMEEYLYKDVRMMLDEGSYLSAFDLTGYLFVKVGNVDMDDSDGGVCFFSSEGKGSKTES